MCEDITITSIGIPIEKPMSPGKWIQPYKFSKEPDKFWKYCYETVFRTQLMKYFICDRSEALKLGLLPPDPHVPGIEHIV